MSPGQQSSNQTQQLKDFGLSQNVQSGVMALLWYDCTNDVRNLHNLLHARQHCTLGYSSKLPGIKLHALQSAMHQDWQVSAVTSIYSSVQCTQPLLLLRYCYSASCFLDTMHITRRHAAW